MTEQDLRALVREAIARHLEGSGAPAGPAAASVVPVTAVVHGHFSHARFTLPALGESCIIEPAVPCNHCGFCKSYGH